MKKKRVSKANLIQLVEDPQSIMVWSKDAVTAPGGWRYCGIARSGAAIYAKKFRSGVYFELMGYAWSGKDVQFDVRPCVVCGKPTAAFVEEHGRLRPCTPCIKDQDEADRLARAG